MNSIVELLNEWWENEAFPEEFAYARVVLIFKKGDTKDLKNYGPMSLLNSLYNIFAAIIQKRLAEKLDRH